MLTSVKRRLRTIRAMLPLLEALERRITAYGFLQKKLLNMASNRRRDTEKPVRIREDLQTKDQTSNGKDPEQKEAGQLEELQECDDNKKHFLTSRQLFVKSTVSFP